MGTTLRRAGLLSGLAGLLALAGCGGGSAPAPAPSPPASAVAPTASAPAATTPPPVRPYAALGDSYTSGLRIPPQQGTPRGCARSGVNYPSLVAARLGLSGQDFRDVSCSGARTGDLTAPQQAAGGANPAQLEAVSDTTRLVTLGIGGNDVGFMDVLGRCAMESVKRSVAAALTEQPGAEAPCRAHYSTGDGTDEVGRAIEATGPKVAEAVREIRRRAPLARVLLVGYPAMLPADPAACAATLGSGVAPGDLAFLAEKQRQLDAMLRRSAEQAGGVFVDTSTPSAGHDMCAGEDERWVEPPLPAAGLAPLHPNARGEQGMAAAVLAAVTP
ncbi:SGNH/GDSL hydrolase family protein [Kitasatospora sp. NPDC088346]|uniref:SGNH/GDSL hydrolase family protein n=1 Tax=Kitasatospora sp. NPDC088346 TaxID=3364073 RepID=UPI00381CD0EF